MKTFFIALFAVLVPMLIIDGIWLAVMLKRFYALRLGHLMAAVPKFSAAGLFYLIYAVGLAVLVVLPAMRSGSSLVNVFFIGALLGLVAYGTYDLTNQATLKDWPVLVTVVDLIWGSLMTGSVAAISVLISRYFV